MISMKFNNIQTIKNKINNEEPLTWVDNALLSGFSKDEIIKMSEPKEQLPFHVAIQHNIEEGFSMNQLNHTMIKEFYKHNKEVQNKKTYKLDIKRNVFKHGRRFFKYNIFELRFY